MEELDMKGMENSEGKWDQKVNKFEEVYFQYQEENHYH